MITTVSIHDAKTNLSKYLAAVDNGEKVYIGPFGKPRYQITIIPEAQKPKKRDFSALKGMIIAGPEAFTKETDQEIADLMLNGDL